ncbi:coenzyme F420-0:L-glutamate ligase [Candidatus Gracilibacteria bacterium]|nr:coenzyme F420-0:L-glutamate ligase [Candidatus Gracilibacteria bacterium]
MELIRLKSQLIMPKNDLFEVILKAVSRAKVAVKEGDIFVVSSKVVAVTQGRVVELDSVIPSPRARKLKLSRYGKGKEDPRVVELVLREADKVMPGNMLLALKDHILIPAAGIDLSNVEKGKAILWPNKPWETARELWNALKKKYGLKKIGVVIIDSHCQPLRWGTTGIALAWAGFEGIEDVRGTKDLMGNTLHVTQKAVADNLASASQLVMGEGAEKTPFVLVRAAPVHFTNKKVDSSKTFVTLKDDIFSGVLNF